MRTRPEPRPDAGPSGFNARARYVRRPSWSAGSHVVARASRASWEGQARATARRSLRRAGCASRPRRPPSVWAQGCKGFMHSAAGDRNERGSTRGRFAMQRVASTFAVEGCSRLDSPRPARRPPPPGGQRAPCGRPRRSSGGNARSRISKRPALSAATRRCRCTRATRLGPRSSSRYHASSTPRARRTTRASSLLTWAVLVDGPRPQHVPHSGPAAGGVLRRAGDDDWMASIPRCRLEHPDHSCDPNYLGADRRTTYRGRRRCSRPGRRARRAMPQPAPARRKQTEPLHNMTMVDNAKDVNSIRKALGVTRSPTTASRVGPISAILTQACSRRRCGGRSSTATPT